MTSLLQFLELLIPHEPHCIVAYVVAALLLVVGIAIIVRASRRNRPLRREFGLRSESVAHRRATAAYHAKLKESEGRGF